ncbi:MAG: ATP-binding protein [Thiohalocapsa sp.]|nr:ATP-binding protein [Thiohalocapsa sp.]
MKQPQPTTVTDNGARQTAWSILTGPPSAGKTSIIERLAARGHRVVGETARNHIAGLGKSPARIAADRALQLRIQQEIATLQHAVEARLEALQPVFLDRALPDSVAYFRRLGLSVDTLLGHGRRLRYRHVFFIEGLPLSRDGLRFEEDAEARLLGEEIHAAYSSLGYAPITVPAFADLPPADSIEQRVSFILTHIDAPSV